MSGETQQMIDLGLTGKRVIVSGAGFLPERAGHGRQTSLKLAEAGATVACIDIDEGRARGIVSEIEMTSVKELEAAYERVVKSDVKYRFVIDLATL